MRFARYIGIDYSGAATPESRLRNLQVYQAMPEGEPAKVVPTPAGARQSRHWSRREIAAYCEQALTAGPPVIIGIDHGFSFPLSYMARHDLDDWDAFLQDFVTHWPTDTPGCSVESLRQASRRGGDPGELRLCEQWTATAKSVFLFDVQGSVAKSTHAGLPWIHRLRRQPALRAKVHFWPFDGFEVPAGKSLVAEAYPALCKRRFPRTGRTPDEQDAWALAAWMRECDRRGSLGAYLEPPLTAEERTLARLEGWILGVC